MGRITRALSRDGSAMAMAISATDIVTRIEQVHQTSAVVTAAAGRLAAAASMMGVLLKAEKDTHIYPSNPSLCKQEIHIVARKQWCW